MKLSRDLQEYCDLPAPPFGPVNARKMGYREDVPILLDAPGASEPCTDIADFGIAGDNHYNIASNPPYFLKVPGSISQLLLRDKVANLLNAVNTRLKPAGLEIYVFDAWRPQAIQRYFHDIWFPDWLRANRPDIPEADLMQEVEAYWSAPSAGKTSPSPHSTGGAVDLTLRFIETGQPLYMGGLFDDLTENAHTDWFEREALVSMSDEQARQNRRLLFWVMHDAGFANNPTEWWHYSWGDQMWARLRGHSAACYGACDPLGLDGD